LMDIGEIAWIVEAARVSIEDLVSCLMRGALGAGVRVPVEFV
jgi:hypothetical protein